MRTRRTGKATSCKTERRFKSNCAWTDLENCRRQCNRELCYKSEKLLQGLSSIQWRAHFIAPNSASNAGWIPKSFVWISRIWLYVTVRIDVSLNISTLCSKYTNGTIRALAGSSSVRKMREMGPGKEFINRLDYWNISTHLQIANI